MKNSIEYLDKIIGIIEKPYFKELGLYGLNDIEEWEYVIRKVFGIDIRVVIGFTGYTIYDMNGNRVYFEDIGFYWERWEYNSDGNEIYEENSDGYKINFEIGYPTIEYYYEEF
jgi:hypothetical protein